MELILICGMIAASIAAENRGWAGLAKGMLMSRLTPPVRRPEHTEISV